MNISVQRNTIISSGHAVRGHGVKLVVFFLHVFFHGFWHFWDKVAKTLRKLKKKVSTHGEGMGRWTGDMG